MTGAALDNLKQEKIQQLLAAVAAESAQDAGQNIETHDYDWRQPRYFSQGQLNQVKSFAESVATAASTGFTQFYQGDFEVTSDSISEHLASEFLLQNPDQQNGDYYLAFGPAPAQPAGAKSAEPWGLIAMPPETAAAWITQSLGDSASQENSIETLSELEESLLFDIASIFVQAISAACDNQEFKAIGGITTGRLPLEVEGTEELCKITFATKKPDDQQPFRAFLLTRCDRLEVAAGIVKEVVETLGPADAANAIAQHLNHMHVRITAVLGSTSVTLEDLLNLAPGDIIVLDKRINDPLELTVEGLNFLRGRSAKSEGKYAVVITHNTALKGNR